MLILDKLTSHYDSWQCQFSSQLRQGSISALIGPSGAGKSTLLGMLAGFITVDSGRLEFAGQNLLPLRPAERPITTLFQDNNLFLHLSVHDNIAIGLHPGLSLTAAQKEQVLASAQRVGLLDKLAQKPESLSGGQQQRVAIARALVRDKPLLLLDEPFSALDPALRQEMLKEVAKLAHEQGNTVLMVSHNPEDARLIADQILFVERGTIHLQGPVSLLSDSQDPFLRRYLGAPFS